MEPPLAAQGLAIAAIGPITAGCSVHILLTGIILSMMGSFVSSGRFNREKPAMRTLVCLVFTLNLVQLGISIGDILQWSCTQKRDYDAMFAGTKMDSLTPLVVGLEAFIVQGIYAHRAFTLFRTRWRKWVFVVVVGLAMVASVFGALITTILNFGYASDTFTSLGLLEFDPMTSLWLWSSFAVDTTISVALWSIFHSNVAGFNPRMDFVLVKLAQLAVQTASYTALTALLGALFAELFTSDYTVAISYPFLLVLPALYTISIFVTLGAKQELNDELSQTHSLRVSSGSAKPVSHSSKSPPRQEEARSNQSYVLSIQEVERSMSLDSRC